MENQNNLEEYTDCNEKEQEWVVPYLVVDIIFNVFVRLPARKVYELRYSCKEWYNLFRSSRFILAHFHHSNHSLISIPMTKAFLRRLGVRYARPDIIQIRETKISVRNLSREFVDNASKFVDNTSKFVVNTCNGLVLFEDRLGNLTVSNPATGQMLTLPPCSPRSDSLKYLLGITFVDSTGEYKVVSIAVNLTGLLGCEVLALGSSKWDWINSPFQQIIKWFPREYTSITVKGVFYFMLSGLDMTYGEAVLYVASFDSVEEKFYLSKLPRCICHATSLHEIDGCVSVIVPNYGRICYEWEVWALEDLCTGEWRKRYNVGVCGMEFFENWFQMRVNSTLENGRFWIFEREGQGFEYYVFDVRLQKMRSLELDPRTIYIMRPYIEWVVPLPMR